MEISEYFLNNTEEFMFNILGIEDISSSSASRFRFWFDHIKENSNKEGDIFEFGVYQGSSLISAALILKKFKSKKIVYGFDSFEGFPNYHLNDNLDSFYKYEDIYFDKDHLNKFEMYKKTLEAVSRSNIDKENISTQGEFKNTTKALVESKLKILGLDNVVLIKGDFKETVPHFFKSFKGKISSANIDCDLYEGYKITLPYVWEQLTDKGFIYLDEYYSLKFPGARIACEEFFELNAIKPKKLNSRENEFERWCIVKENI